MFLESSTYITFWMSKLIQQVTYIDISNKPFPMHEGHNNHPCKRGPSTISFLCQIEISRLGVNTNTLQFGVLVDTDPRHLYLETRDFAQIAAPDYSLVLKTVPDARTIHETTHAKRGFIHSIVLVLDWKIQAWRQHGHLKLPGSLTTRLDISISHQKTLRLEYLGSANMDT